MTMKQRILYLVLLFALATLYSCSKSEVIPNEQPDVQPYAQNESR